MFDRLLPVLQRVAGNHIFSARRERPWGSIFVLTVAAIAVAAAI